MPDDLAPPISGSSELVAESYPPLPAVEPVKTHRIHWLLALPAALAALICPRRMGAHLAASSWTAAYVAHFLSIVLFWGTMWAFICETEQAARSGGGLVSPSLSLSEHVRQPFGACTSSATWRSIPGRRSSRRRSGRSSSNSRCGLPPSC